MRKIDLLYDNDGLRCSNYRCLRTQ